ncbi:Avirulence protein (Avh), partial [Phytophthora palmivora]
MRLGQFLLVVVFTFVACSVSIVTATTEAPSTLQAISSNNEPVRENHRYLKGSQKTTKTTHADDEERAGVNPKVAQFLRTFSLPKNFLGLGRLQQVIQLRNQFGEKAGS